MIDRNTGISGTEVAALFGMSPYLTKYELYLSKKGLRAPVEQTERMRIGKKLEPVVVGLFEEDSGKKVQWFDQLMAHPKEPLIIGSPDGFVEQDANFQAKTAGLDRAFEWGDAGTDTVPGHYLIAEQHYMLLTGRPKSYLAALIGGNDFRVFPLAADEEIQANILEEIRRFWADHILTDTPPPMDGSQGAKDYLLKMFPSAKDGVREATPDEEELIIGLLQTKKERVFIEKREEELKNKLRQSIGFSKGVASAAGKALWSEIPGGIVQSFERKPSRRLTVTGKRGEE